MLLALVALALTTTASPQPPTAQTPPSTATPPQQPTPPSVRTLTLERAVTLALERNVDAVRSRLQVNTAEADATEARAAILPRLDFNASLSRSLQNGGEVTGSFVDAEGRTVQLRSPTEVYSTYFGGFLVQQLLFDGGTWWNNLDARRLGLAAAQESAEEARLQTTYVVEQRFYDLILAQHQLTVLTDAATRSRDQADVTERLVAAGRQSQADLFAARANRDNDELLRIAQQTRVEVARQDLAIAIGAAPGETVVPEEPPNLLEQPQSVPRADDEVERALAGRPAIRALEKTAESQRRTSAAVGGGYWPTVSLAAEYSRETRDLATFTSGLDKATTLTGGVLLTWNLFNGFATKAQVQRADVQVRQAENALLDARRGVVADVEKALARLAAAHDLVQVATRSEQNAKEALRLARARQELGVATQLEVRDAELKFTQAQLSRLGALIGGREAESALRRAVGNAAPAPPAPAPASPGAPRGG